MADVNREISGLHYEKGINSAMAEQVRQNVDDYKAKAQKLDAPHTVAQHLQDDISRHTLATTIADLNADRSKNPNNFDLFLKSVNDAAHENGALPSYADILGLDSTGTKLVVYSMGDDRLVEIDADGASKTADSSKYLKPVSSSDLGGAENFPEKDYNFNAVLAPGLFSGKPDVEDMRTVSRSEKLAHNADGTVTHQYAGSLNNSFTNILDAQDGHIYDHSQNTSFKAKLTTNADGKILSSAVDYDPHVHSWTNYLGVHHEQTTSDYPFMNLSGAAGRVLDAHAKSVETKFSPLTMTYISKEHFSTGAIENVVVETNKAGKVVNTGFYGNRELDAQNQHILDMNSQGRVTCIRYEPRDVDESKGTLPREQWPKATFAYDTDDNLVGVTEHNGTAWTKISGGADAQTWKVTANGATKVWQGKMFVDDAGQIIRKTQTGTEVVAANGDSSFFDTQGRPTRSESDAKGWWGVLQYVTDDKGAILGAFEKTPTGPKKVDLQPGIAEHYLAQPLVLVQ